MAQYKIVYFNVRRRGEVSRLILAAAGQQFEDVRLEKPKWIAEYKADAPLGHVPYLEVTENGNVFRLGQSFAVARFLARRFHLDGTNEYEKGQVDM